VTELTYINERRFAQTRMPAARREDLSAEEQVIYDRIIARASENGEYRAVQRRHYYGMLLHSPQFAMRLGDMGSSIKMLASRRNLALVTVGAEAPCYFLLMGHVADAVATGVRPEGVRGIIDGDDNPLSPDERVLSGFTRQIVKRQVNDETFAAAKAMLGVRGTAEFVAVVSLYLLVAQFSSAFGIPEPPREEVDGLLAEVTRLAASGAPGFGIENWDRDNLR